MSSKKFGDLDVVNVVLRQKQSCLWRDDLVQHMTLIALRDNVTRESGHVLYCAEIDKREVVEEEIWTDNPKLFTTCRGEGDGQDLMSLDDDDTPSEATEDVKKILRDCWDGSPVVYRDGHDGWGLYAG